MQQLSQITQMSCSVIVTTTKTSSHKSKRGRHFGRLAKTIRSFESTSNRFEYKALQGQPFVCVADPTQSNNYFFSIGLSFLLLISNHLLFFESAVRFWFSQYLKEKLPFILKRNYPWAFSFTQKLPLSIKNNYALTVAKVVVPLSAVNNIWRNEQSR